MTEWQLINRVDALSFRELPDNLTGLPVYFMVDELHNVKIWPAKMDPTAKIELAWRVKND